MVVWLKVNVLQNYDDDYVELSKLQINFDLFGAHAGNKDVVTVVSVTFCVIKIINIIKSHEGKKYHSSTAF